MGLVTATWIGPSGLTLVDGTVLECGITTAEISEGEALASDHWSYEAPKSSAKGTNNNGASE
jgi:hypothetical protein